jgi:hypothetical protein
MTRITADISVVFPDGFVTGPDPSPDAPDLRRLPVIR